MSTLNRIDSKHLVKLQLHRSPLAIQDAGSRNWSFATFQEVGPMVPARAALPAVVFAPPDDLISRRWRSPGSVSASLTGCAEIRLATGSCGRGSNGKIGLTAGQNLELWSRASQSANVTSPCLTCGGRAKKMHRPLFHRGTFCPRCCPVCAPKTAPAVGIATTLNTAVATQRPARRTAEGATQWKDAGWGHRPNDPWYHDRDRHQSRPRWIPSRPRWFR